MKSFIKTIPVKVTESQVKESQPTYSNIILTNTLISKNKRKKMERMEVRKQRQRDYKKRKKDLKKQNEKCQEIIKKEPHSVPISSFGQSSRISKEEMKNKYLEKMRNGIRVCIDLSFTDLMTEKELKSCAFQIRHSYSINKHAKIPLYYHITSVNSTITDYFANNQGYENWQIEKSSKNYIDIFPQKDIIYLVAESPNVLTELNPNFVYVIGGIVDRNRLKGICNVTAIEKNLKTARLPIQEYMTGITSRTVLTINQVFEILCEYANTNNWEKALVKGLPARKGFLLKSSLNVSSI